MTVATENSAPARGVTATERLVVAVVLAVAVALIVGYWAVWYADRGLVASNDHAAYYAFENAFPLADGWLALGCTLAAVMLLRRSATALLWLLVAGGAGIYLFAMDTLYDIEHRIWWSSGAGGWIELAINVMTVGASGVLLRWSWTRRADLLSSGRGSSRNSLAADGNISRQ